VGASTCVQTGGVAKCSGGTPFCNEADDACYECTVDANCTDALFCNGAETCDGRACSSPGLPCSGITPMCNEENDVCVQCLTNADCDNDYIFCNGEEICSFGECGSMGTPCSGSTSKCNEDTDQCVACLNNSDCPEGDFCTGDPTCSGSNVCGYSGDPCIATGQLCNQTGSECVNPAECAINSDCEDLDGLFCNGQPICTTVYTCGTSGTPCSGETPECLEATDECVECVTDDNCTTELPFCVENACVECEIPADCPDDSLYCNGGPSCTANVCGFAGTPPCSGGTPECLEGSDTCVECVSDDNCTGFCVGNVCVECEEDANCYDDIFCNGVESCAAGACVDGPGDPCTFLGLVCDEDSTGCVGCLTNADCAEGEICDAESDSCEASSGCTSNDNCTDDLFCTGVESCVAGACVAGPGDPCKAGETCDEQKEECVSAVVCETDADCAGDGLFCNGIEVCVFSARAEATPVEQGICESPGNPCKAGETCNEANNTCEVATGGTIQIDKCTVKAGKEGKGDSIQFSGLLDAKEADFPMGGDVVVIIEAAAIPDLNATTFAFPVDEGSVKKGKYKSPKDTSDPVASLQIDTNKGTIKFSAKNADLTGLGCPITVTIQIGDYSAEVVLGEDIVNGPKKPCPPELLE
jgi:Cys-rich repeat protein